MIILWGVLAGMLTYVELIYHFCGYGLSGYAPWYALLLIVAWSGIGTLIVGVVKGKAKKILFYLFIYFPIIWTGVQLVYLRIFKQPLLWEAMIRGGQDALSNYWREALEGVLQTLPSLVLLFIPAVVLGILMRKKKWELPAFGTIQILRMLVVTVVGMVGAVTFMEVGGYLNAEYYEDYKEFYDPHIIAERMGVLPTLQRDTVINISSLAQGAWRMLTEEAVPASGQVNAAQTGETYETMQSGEPEGEEGTDTATQGTDSENETQEPPETQAQQEPAIVPHAYPIDFEKLHALADNDNQMWLADYIEGMVPDSTNEYTGLFEGYNLIYLTAEGFSPYAVSEELTPTLYRLINSGFVFDNYYVPLWQTSTSDGEYINCTGLIPDGQFSMRKSGQNRMAFTLANFFAGEGVSPLAYHNNSLSYYDRYVTHPNLGYDFRGCKLGSLSQEEWGDKVFTMENPDAWPSSDLDMMQGTLPEYLNQERFHVYYMTISGHMNYNFSGNAMSSKNKDAVAGLDMSENARAYIACNMELDKALEYLLEELEKAGKLENTVICMSADHYPYAMTQEQYEELAGKDLSAGKDLYRNNLILWNAQMEEEPIHISKPCGSMDIVPTLLNLFGFSYDSRMYAGRDILSEQEGMVIFNDRSFVTDALCYNRAAKELIWYEDEEGNPLIGEEAQESYFEEKKQDVKDRYQFSAYILRENYYEDILGAMEE